MHKDDYARVRILVIEDERYIRQIVCRLLREIGFDRIDEAGDGVEGFKEILRTKPDIILCDIHMNPVDGMTFLKKLRGFQDQTLSSIPVVFLTSDTNVDQVQRSKELSVDGYIAKPVSLALLKKRLDQVIERRSLQTV